MFESFVVARSGTPIVTPQAGIDLADRYWTTTSSAAAKVAMIRATGVAGVLREDDGQYRLTVGRASVIDPRHPLQALRDPVSAGFSGAAIARLAATHTDQIVGYAQTWRSIPTSWSLWSRVVLCVRHTHTLTWDGDGRIVASEGGFGDEYPVPRARAAGWRSQLPPLDDDLGSLLSEPGSACLGLVGRFGPVAIPATWEPQRVTATVPDAVVARLCIDWDRGGCVMIDRSDDPRPTGKAGVAVRGPIQVLSRRAGQAVIGLSVERVTSWHGFASGTTAA